MAAPVSPGAEPRRSRHAPTFALLIGALMGIAVGAVALAVVLLAGERDPRGGWSAWRPSSDGVEAVQEIANHVGPKYRLPDGKQLVTVTGGELKIADLPARLATTAEAGAISVLDGGTVLFTLCGNGERCSIATGKPSFDRLLLLQREALELALHAFRYVDDVEYVVVMLPPTFVGRRPGTTAGGGPGQAAAKASVTVRAKARSTAMLLRREQLGDAVDEPLATTLPPPTPTVRTISGAPERPLIEAIGSSMQGMRLVQAQDGSAVVLLEPLAK